MNELVPTSHMFPIADNAYSLQIGRVVDVAELPNIPFAGQHFDLTEQMLGGHMAVLGGTGSGKSKFLELLMRRIMLSRRGLCFVDPHGDTAEDLLAYIGHRRGDPDKGDDELWRRVHYFEATYENVPKYDPFQFRPLQSISPENYESAYVAWLHTKVDRISEILQRKQGQSGFDGMPRLQRVLRNVLFACGMSVGQDGRHLPLSDALVLLNVHHEMHREVFDRVKIHLDSEILGDFAVLHGFKRDEDRRRETESTINRLRSFLSPIVKCMFSNDGTRPSLNFRSVVQNQEILIVNLRETEYFSTDQKNAIGGLVIHEILTAVSNTPPKFRKSFMLVIDEAAELIGQDLQRALGAVRKYKLSIVLAAQDLSSFRKGDDFDMTAKVLSQCKTVVCFDQQYRDDKQLMADRIFSGNVDYSERWEEIDRDAGYEWISMDEFGETFMEGENADISQSLAAAKGGSEQNSTTDSSSQNRGERTSIASDYPDGILARGIDKFTTGKDEGRTSAKAHGHSISNSWSNTETMGSKIGRSRSKSVSVTHKMLPLHQTRTELRPVGQLEQGPVDQQLQKFAGLIGLLPQRIAAVKARDIRYGFLLMIDEVRDFFPSDDAKYAVLEWIRREVLANWSYNAVPNLSHKEEETRLVQFIQSTASSNGAEMKQQPPSNQDDLPI